MIRKVIVGSIFKNKLWIYEIIKWKNNGIFKALAKDNKDGLHSLHKNHNKKTT